jgi:hypothetical protein
MKILHAMIAAAVVLVSGCGTNPSVPAQLVGMVAIGQGTARFIEHKETSSERSWRATEVIRIAGLLRTVAEGEDVSVADLQARALELIAGTSLGLADQALANTLVVGIGDYLRQQIAEGVLNPRDTVRVTTVLEQIAAAARPYVEPAGP